MSNRPRQTRMVENIEGDVYAEAAMQRVNDRRREVERTQARNRNQEEEEDSPPRGGTSPPPGRRLTPERNRPEIRRKPVPVHSSPKPPSPQSRATPPPPKSAQSRSSSKASSSRSTTPRPARKPPEESESEEEVDPGDSHCCCSCSRGGSGGGGGCGGCSCFSGFLSWSEWGSMKANSAYFVGVVTALLMVSIGATGFNENWMFCQIGTVRIGALGWCQDGSCIRAFVYDVEGANPSGKIYESTMAGSAILLLYGLGGLIPLLIFGYTFLCRACNMPPSWQSPHHAFRCCRDPESQKISDKAEKLDKQTREDECVSKDEWSRYTNSRREELRAITRANNAFDKTGWLMFGWGAILYPLMMVWMDTVGASEEITYEMIQIGLPLALVAWIITSKIYRHQRRGTTRSKVGNYVADKTRTVRNGAAGVGKRGLAEFKRQPDKITPGRSRAGVK